MRVGWRRRESHPPPCGEGRRTAGKLAQPAQAWLRAAGWGSVLSDEAAQQSHRTTPAPNPSPQGGGEPSAVHSAAAAPHRTAATLTGFTAILMWSLLALLTTASGRVPPFQLAAMTFAIGGTLGAATWLKRRKAAAALRQPLEVWALGVGGLFGYHALYFMALRLAPPAEAQLLNYLWPLLIVLFSALLPDERLKAHHVAGAM